MKAFNLNINPTALQVMIQDAERTHPNECCGFLFGRDDEESRTVEIALPIVNSKEGDQRRRFQITPLEYMKAELDYSIDVKYIDGDAELEKLYGEQVPVTHIDGEHHDFWRVDPERFRACLETHRQRQ